MAAITATAFTEVVEDRSIWGKKKRNRVKLTMSATQGLAYPSSGGIPLPTTLGMVRNVDYVLSSAKYPPQIASFCLNSLHDVQ